MAVAVLFTQKSKSEYARMLRRRRSRSHPKNVILTYSRRRSGKKTLGWAQGGTGR